MKQGLVKLSITRVATILGGFYVIIPLALVLLGPTRATLGAANDWHPAHRVELIVSAVKGESADRLARLIRDIVTKHNLMPQPLVVHNMPAGFGAQGFLAVKQRAGDTHRLIIGQSNVFTAAIATRTDFNWKELTPVCMLGLDEFVLWVPADSPYRSIDEYLKAARAAPGKFKMAGNELQQEDKLITGALEQAANVKFTYVAKRTNRAVVNSLSEKEVDSIISAPGEAVQLWQEGKIRPLGVFDHERMGYRARHVQNAAWADIPTLKEQGYDVQYLMLSGLFAPPDMPAAARKYYIAVMSKVRQTAEWKAYVQNTALKDNFMTGQPFKLWLTSSEITHKDLVAKHIN